MNIDQSTIKQNNMKKEVSQNLKVYDLHNHLLGDVKHIIRDEDNKLQIVFAPPGKEKPLFRVSKQVVRKVDLDRDSIIIFITENMRKELIKHSGDAFDWVQSDSTEASFDETQNEEIDSEEIMSDDTALDEATIRLLEERLKIDRSSKKLGEVIVRKVVETKTIEVPVRQEKLIVEQVHGDQTENLAEIDLSSGVIEDQDLRNTSVTQDGLTVHGEFISLEAASEIIKAISLQKDHGCQKVKIELIVSNSQQQKDYQAMLDQCTDQNSLDSM